VALLGAAPGAAAAGPEARGVSPAEKACPVPDPIGGVSYSCAEEFSVRGTGGYEVIVSAAPGGKQVEVTAESSGGSVEYIAPARVTASTISARLGKVGRIDVRFQPSGRERKVKVPKRCLKERPPVVSATLGRFVGTIKLHGERGYTKVDASSAAGGVGDPLANLPGKLRCEYREPQARAKRELESAQFVGEPKEGLGFSATRLFPGFPGLSAKHAQLLRKAPHFIFFASAGEKADGMAILRSASALGGPQTFLFDEDLSSATITPPAPFTGTGTFQRNADGSIAWTGSLAVQLPGLGSVPLTGGEAELASVEAQEKLITEKLEEELRKHGG